MMTLTVWCVLVSLGPVVTGGKTDPATPPSLPAPRIRTLSPLAGELLSEGAARFATIARLVQKLETYRVLVFVETRLDAAIPTGQTTLLTVTPAGRYVHVVLNAALSRDRRIEALGHELQHALEIASADDVIDSESMRRHFTEIGQVLGSWSKREESFETSAAVDVERQVKRELSARSAIARGPH